MKIFNRQFRVVRLNKGKRKINYRIESRLSVLGIPLWWSNSWINHYRASGAITGGLEFDDADSAFECMKTHKNQYDYYKLPVTKTPVCRTQDGDE